MINLIASASSATGCSLAPRAALAASRSAQLAAPSTPRLANAIIVRSLGRARHVHIARSVMSSRAPITASWTRTIASASNAQLVSWDPPARTQPRALLPPASVRTVVPGILNRAGVTATPLCSAAQVAKIASLPTHLSLYASTVVCFLHQSAAVSIASGPGQAESAARVVNTPPVIMAACSTRLNALASVSPRTRAPNVVSAPSPIRSARRRMQASRWPLQRMALVPVAVSRRECAVLMRFGWHRSACAKSGGWKTSRWNASTRLKWEPPFVNVSGPSNIMQPIAHRLLCTKRSKSTTLVPASASNAHQIVVSMAWSTKRHVSARSSHATIVVMIGRWNRRQWILAVVIAQELHRASSSYQDTRIAYPLWWALKNVLLSQKIAWQRQLHGPSARQMDPVWKEFPPWLWGGQKR